MREARRLAPYVALSALVVIATMSALIVSTLRMPVGPDDTAASPSDNATAAVRPVTELSPAGRLAYWRSEPNGDYLLWVANIDNTRRHSIAKAAGPEAISLTRWSADGSAVAYVEGGVRLVVVRLDGTRNAYELSAELQSSGQRIADARFSPSGRRIAATIQRASFGEFDVVVSTFSGSWTRLTTIRDVHAADWISEDELLVWTGGGVVGRLDASTSDRLRPLTGLFGMTPGLAADGRVHFVGGTGYFTQQGVPQFFGSPAVWSMTVDGDDPRRETTAELPRSTDRLDGVLPWGYLLHDGQARTELLVTTSRATPLPDTTGSVDGAAAPADGRSVIAFAGSTIQRDEIRADGTVSSTVVLLGSADRASAWFPSTRTAVHLTTARAAIPAARYAFALGGHLWSMGPDGVAGLMEISPLHYPQGGADRPRWSPAGDRVLAVETLLRGYLRTVPVVVGPDRVPKVISAKDGADTPSSLNIGQTVTWSPDGAQAVAITNPTGARVAPAEDARAVAVFDAAAGGIVRTLPGREAYWTRAGIAVLSPGTPIPDSPARSGQAVELWVGDARRVVTTVAALTEDPRAAIPADQRGAVAALGLSASDDGAYLAIHLATGTVRGGALRYAVVLAVVRGRDGAPVFFVGSAEAVADEIWSPAGRAFGYTRYPTQLPFAGGAHAVVRDAASGAVLVDVEGRFGGWSPDGSWILIARDDGLWARALDGGELQRFSSVGVAVATTRP